MVTDPGRAGADGGGLADGSAAVTVDPAALVELAGRLRSAAVELDTVVGSLGGLDGVCVGAHAVLDALDDLDGRWRLRARSLVGGAEEVAGLLDEAAAGYRSAEDGSASRFARAAAAGPRAGAAR